MIDVGQQAIVWWELVNWHAACCSEHDRFEPLCEKCAALPQSCPEHPMVNGSFPALSWCPACQATRPGYTVTDSRVVETLDAEEAVTKYKIPHEQRKWGGRWRIFLR